MLGIPELSTERDAEMEKVDGMDNYLPPMDMEMELDKISRRADVEVREKEGRSAVLLSGVDSLWGGEQYLFGNISNDFMLSIDSTSPRC